MSLDFASVFPLPKGIWPARAGNSTSQIPLTHHTPHRTFPNPLQDPKTQLSRSGISHTI